GEDRLIERECEYEQRTRARRPRGERAGADGPDVLDAGAVVVPALTRAARGPSGQSVVGLWSGFPARVWASWVLSRRDTCEGHQWGPPPGGGRPALFISSAISACPRAA